MRLRLSIGTFCAVVQAGAAAVAVPPDPDQIPKIRSQVFDVHYRVNDSALPLTSVRLWYTIDNASTWRHYGRDEDSQSPCRFHAPQEGRFGFYVVVANEAGASGADPRPGTVPQQWAFVDFTPPIVQLHSSGFETSEAGTPVLTIRWTAIDDQLPARPVELAYRHVPAGNWTTIVRDVSNTGRYDWRPSEELAGSVEIRITVKDRAGNAVSAIGPPVELVRPMAVNPSTDRLPEAISSRDFDASQRARQLAQRGAQHESRGEHHLAAARFREALNLDPLQDESLIGLGDALFSMAELDESKEAYGLLLKRIPNHPEALQGLATVLTAQRDFAGAAEQWKRLLEDRPEFVEGWLELGDLANLQGHEVQAIHYYQQVALLNPEAEDVIARARQRLNDVHHLAVTDAREHESR